MRHHVPLERMKTKRKIVLIVAILTVILSVTAILVIGLRRAPEKALLKIMSDRVDLQVKNVHYTEVGDSGMKWEITADTARYRKKENLALFEKVKVRLVMKDGRVFVMNGDRGQSQYPVPRYGNRRECRYRFGKWRPLCDGPPSVPE